MKPSEDLLIRNNGAGLFTRRYLSPVPQPVNFVRQSGRWHEDSATRTGRPGICPTLTVLLRRTIHDRLRRSRPKKNPQRIPASTLPVFPGLRPRIWSRLLCLATKAMSDRLHVRKCRADCGRGGGARAGLTRCARACKFEHPRCRIAHHSECDDR